MVRHRHHHDKHDDQDLRQQIDLAQADKTLDDRQDTSTTYIGDDTYDSYETGDPMHSLHYERTNESTRPSSQGYETYETGDPMESLRYEQTRESTWLSSQYPRSTWKDFPEQYGRPISPDTRSAKYGRKEQDDEDLRRYRREPSAPVFQGEEENWRDAAERFGWAETMRVLQDVLDGKVHRHELHAYAALQLLAACRGYEISDDMAIEELEDMLDEIVKARGRSSPGIGSLGRTREGYGGHYVWYDN